MYDLVPLGLCSSDYRILHEGGAEVGRLIQTPAGLKDLWKGKQEVSVAQLLSGDAEWQVFRPRRLERKWELRGFDGVEATADGGQQGMRHLRIMAEGSEAVFEMKLATVSGSQYIIRVNDQAFGSVAKAHPLTRRGRMDWPLDSALPLMMFCAWIATAGWLSQAQSHH